MSTSKKYLDCIQKLVFFCIFDQLIGKFIDQIVAEWQNIEAVAKVMDGNSMLKLKNNLLIYSTFAFVVRWKQNLS